VLSVIVMHVRLLCHSVNQSVGRMPTESRRPIGFVGILFFILFCFILFSISFI